MHVIGSGQIMVVSLASNAFPDLASRIAQYTLAKLSDLELLAPVLNREQSTIFVVGCWIYLGTVR
jgi:hypothetical protein